MQQSPLHCHAHRISVALVSSSEAKANQLWRLQTPAGHNSEARQVQHAEHTSWHGTRGSKGSAGPRQLSSHKSKSKCSRAHISTSRQTAREELVQEQEQQSRKRTTRRSSWSRSCSRGCQLDAEAHTWLCLSATSCLHPALILAWQAPSCYAFI